MIGRQRWSIASILRYNCRSLKSPVKTFCKLFYLYFNNFIFTLATFNVQNGSLTVINSITGEVCFTCYFLEGSQSQGCYIEYNSLITDYYSGNITIVRTSVDTSTASKCVTGIYTSNYNVTFYDMDYNNVPYTTEYAVKLTNQLVTGLFPTPIFSTLSSMSLMSSTKSSSSPSSTLGKSKLLQSLCHTCCSVYYYSRECSTKSTSSNYWYVSYM